MTEASRVQKMLNEQNEWIDKLKSQIMRLELDVVGYRTKNKQLEAALRDCVNVLACFERPDFYQLEQTSPIKPYALGALDVARKALEGKDD